MGERLEALRAAIDAAIVEGLREDDPSGVRGGMVTGWVFISELTDVDGEAWLHRVDSSGMTTWKRDGMLHQALYSDGWDRPEDD